MAEYRFHDNDFFSRNILIHCKDVAFVREICATKVGILTQVWLTVYLLGTG